MTRRRIPRGIILAAVALLIVSALGAWPAFAFDKGDAREVDENVAHTLQRFRDEVGGADKLLRKAKGVLVFSKVIQAGLGFGGEHGEGKLMVHDKTVDYYEISAGSFGLQIGAQKKDIMLLFMTDKSLRQFRDSEGWKVGIDGDVVLVKVGAGTSVDTDTVRDPIIGFVLGQKGLMFNVSLQGSKIGRLKIED